MIQHRVTETFHVSPKKGGNILGAGGALRLRSYMHNSLFRLLALIGICTACLASNVQGQDVVVRPFPEREDVQILCWSAPEKDGGFVSQIIVFQADKRGSATPLWQSHIENAYSPQIRFIPEIVSQGLPLVLVERQTGAASSQLDVIGKTTGHVGRLLQIDGFQFDVETLDGSKLPVIIAHRDASILDVPAIYRWSGDRFVDDSRIHRTFYQELLKHDKEKLPPDASAIVLLNLSKIAVLAGDLAEAKTILDNALSRERAKGSEASPEILKLIAANLRTLTPDSRTPRK